MHTQTPTELRPGQVASGIYITWLIPTGTYERPAWLVDVFPAVNPIDPMTHNPTYARASSTWYAEAEARSVANRIHAIASRTTDPSLALAIRTQALAQ